MMSAWGRAGNLSKVYEWFDRLRRENYFPDQPTWAILLRAWSIHATCSEVGSRAHTVHDEIVQRTESAMKAQELLEKMIDMFEKDQQTQPPLVMSYNIVIDMWSQLAQTFFDRCDDQNSASMAAKQAREIILRMERDADRDEAFSKPDVIGYCSVLTAYCRSRNVEEAEKMLRELVHRASSTLDDPLLNVQTFSCVISGWALVDNQDDVGFRADQLLRTLEECGFVPNEVTYSGCITCWAKAAEFGNKAMRIHAVDRSETILKDMKNKDVPWDAYILANLLTVYEKASELEKAQDLLGVWLREYEHTNNPNLKPDAVVFTPLLMAWKKSGLSDSAESAMALLRLMPKYGAEPNVFSYSAVLRAFSLSEKSSAADNALKLFYEMQTVANVQPDVYTWTNLISTMVKHRKFEKAESMLLKMISTNAPPDAHTFNVILSGWAKSGDENAVERAAALLLKMKRLFEGGIIDHAPNKYCLNSVMDCFERANRPGMAKKAELLMSSMSLQFRIDPDRISYNIMMKAWANEGNWAKLLHYFRELQHFSESKGWRGPDGATFRIIWRGIQNARHLTANQKVNTMERMAEEFAKLDLYSTGVMRKEMEQLQREAGM